MNPEIKKLWVDALKSGEYEQGRGALCVGESFCCLGVLCDLAVKQGARVRVAKERDKTTYDSRSACLPPSVSDWAGLDNAWGEYKTNTRGDGNLANLNDVGKTFNQIAYYIERYF